MKKIVTVLSIALLGVLAACAPSTERVLGENSRTYLLERGLFDRQAEFIIKDADTDLNVYRVEPPVVSLRDTLVIRDVQGPTLGRIIRRSLVLVPTYEIYRDGEQVASLGTELSDVISNALVGNVTGNRYTITMSDGTPNFEVRGNVFELDYDIYRQDVRVGHVSRAPLSRTYFVEVAEGQDDVLLLETVIALNELTANQQENQ